jgi:phospholipase A1/A2
MLFCVSFAHSVQTSSTMRRKIHIPLLLSLISGSSYADSYLQQRLAQETKSYENSWVLIPHKNNYILPATYIHRADAAINPGGDYRLKHAETKFQVSFKTLVFPHPIFKDNGLLFVSYTNTSVWQSYNRTNSSPFRDSNHEPEIFMFFHTPWQWKSFSMPLIMPGINHQSNGQNGTRSRSWNRIYLKSYVEYHDWLFAFKPWLRIPERKKRHINDAKGDDNPDIQHYLGHFEFEIGKKFGDNQFNLLIRNNLKQDNKGYVQVNFTRPFGNHIKAYVQLSHGYGEMLLDYNQRNTRIGFGFMFNNGL